MIKVYLDFFIKDESYVYINFDDITYLKKETIKQCEVLKYNYLIGCSNSHTLVITEQSFKELEKAIS